MPRLAGRETLGQAGYNGTLAGLQDPPDHEGLSGVDILRHQICPGPFRANGPVDMLEDGDKIDSELCQTVLRILKAKGF